MNNTHKYNRHWRTAWRLLIVIVTSLSTSTIKAQSFSPDDTVTEYNATATYYADKFVGRKTSSGEIFTQDKYTAAHHSIKFGTLVLVTNPKNGKQVIVKVNDRCPRHGVIDLTRKGIGAIGIKGSGKVTFRLLPKSYQYIWEHQDELKDPETGLQIPNIGINTGIVPIDNLPEKENKNEAPKNQKNPTPTAEKQPAPKQQTAKQPSTTSSTAPVVKKDPRSKYDILLEIGVPRSQAERKINKLPMHLRENAQLQPDQATGKLKLVLVLSTTEKRAHAIQKGIRKKFPNCQLVAID